MSRIEELEALSRERSLTEREVEALYRLQFPSQQAQGKRIRYQRCKDTVNANRRWKWLHDPDWRERKRANDKAWRERKGTR